MMGSQSPNTLTIGGKDMLQILEDSGERREFSTGAVRDRGGLKPRPDLISPHAQMREGMIHTLGSEKYDLRNWEQGMPISECLASAQRHIEQYKRGDTNEDHIAQARWNLGAIIHFEEEIKAGRMDSALDDMPKYAQRPDWETEDGRGVVLSDMELDALERKAWDIPLINTTVTPQKVPNPRTLPESPCESEAASALNLIEYLDQGYPPPISAEPPTFYIAGPMRGCEELNFKAFDEAAERGRRMGFNIISPADLDREQGIDPNKDPTVAEQENHLSVTDLHRIIRRDLEAIMALQPKRGDGIAVLRGWRDSTGATAEVALARWLGLKVVQANDFRTHAIEKRRVE